MTEEDLETENDNDVMRNVKVIYKAIETLLDGMKCDMHCLDCPFWNTKHATCKAHLFTRPENYFVFGRLNLKNQMEYNDELKELMRLIEEKKK